MFDHTNYVPILKGKRGEFAALRKLAPDVRDRITPLIEIVPPPPPKKTKEGQPPPKPKTFHEHLKQFPELLMKSWKAPTRFFIDTQLLPPDATLPDGTHPLLFLYAKCSEQTLFPVPVAGPISDPPSPYDCAVKTVIAQGSQGVCFRIHQETLFGRKLNECLDAMLQYFGASRSRADLILDMASINANQETLVSTSLADLIRKIDELPAWRSLTVAASGFPSTLSSIQANGVGELSRVEWRIWNTLLNEKPELPRRPTFGDYAIQHPELPPETHVGSAHIRYTTREHWVIFKGKKYAKTREDEDPQFVGLSRLARNHPDYSGKKFSAGDKYIFDCADKDVGAGNLQTWRDIGTNHHLTFVARQVANLFSASASSGP